VTLTVLERQLFTLLVMPFALLAMPFALLAMPFALRRKVGVIIKSGNTILFETDLESGHCFGVG